MSAAVEQMVSDATAVRPFRVDVAEAELTDLRRRIKATRLPEKEPVADMSQGVALATVENLARYWANDYNWRKCEARINVFPNFITEIDGLDIHFIHARSKHENALPIIITHGWPYSVAALLKIIEPLTHPTAHGGTASDAFHVVIPSLPGYGYSGQPASTDLSADEKLACDLLAVAYTNVHYALYMASRPQTLYGIADSPVGLAAWMIDFPYSLDMIARSIDGLPESLTRDDVLDNCTLYWLTNTGVSSSRLYRENTFNYFTPKGVNIPVAVSVFPEELYLPPRSWAEKAYPKLIHFNRVAKGGHFAAWEQPEIFTDELRAGFRSLRG